MPSRRLRAVLFLTVLAPLLASCGTSPARTQLAVPRPNANLLADCPYPRFVADPDRASQAELDGEKISLGEAWACERSSRRELVGWTWDNLMGGGSRRPEPASSPRPLS